MLLYFRFLLLLFIFFSSTLCFAFTPDEFLVLPSGHTVKPEQLGYKITVEANKQVLVKSFDSYYFTIGEGKYVPTKDKDWVKYFRGAVLEVAESFSMPFFTVNKGKESYLVIFENPFDTYLTFAGAQSISFSFYRLSVPMRSDNDMVFYVYKLKHDPFNIAAFYRSFVNNSRKIYTLADKSRSNSNVKKLYGAAHIYLYDMSVVAIDDINWNGFRKNAMVLKDWSYNRRNDYYYEFIKVLDACIAGRNLDNYQKKVVVNYLSLTLQGDYNKNKTSIYRFLPDIFTTPPSRWADHKSVGILKDMYESGIDRLWIGLDDWRQAIIKPELVTFAESKGYLIAPYDSYHSIHSSGNEKWITAAFDNKSLYDNATVRDKDGKYISGYKKIGRKLNSSIIYAEVIKRVSSIIKQVPFNSWFIDCDATGEVYDDYSPDHPQTKELDAAARLFRLKKIGDLYGLVMGSEGGADFAINSISFAHGVELPAFSWMDKDMGINKKSKFYLGRYYNPNGGAPEVKTKPVALKPYFYKIYLDPAYTVPFYKIVYNNSIVTTYHWDWGSLKLKDYVPLRRLYETAYNIPPMYHIDNEEWQKHKANIVEHYRVWSNIARELTDKVITNFEYLDDKRLVHLIEYTDEAGSITIIANFSEKVFYNKKYGSPIGAMGFKIINNS